MRELKRMGRFSSGKADPLAKRVKENSHFDIVEDIGKMDLRSEYSLFIYFIRLWIFGLKGVRVYKVSCVE